jgi:hypothetical protein
MRKSVFLAVKSALLTFLTVGLTLLLYAYKFTMTTQAVCGKALKFHFQLSAV